MSGTKLYGYRVESFASKAWVSKGEYFANLEVLKLTRRLEAKDGASALNVARSDIDAIDRWCKANGYKPKERKSGNPQVSKERRSARR